MPETLRFIVLLQAAGVPQVYLPFIDPRSDRRFMKAVREKRVLSLKQTPTGTQKDHGVVGALFERHIAYLIFSKSLRVFEGKRVVGIKYDQLSQAETVTPEKGPTAKPQKQAKVKPAPKPKPPPEPESFEAHVRVTATKEVTLTVLAFTQKEARTKALDAVRGQSDFSNVDFSYSVFELKAKVERTR